MLTHKTERYIASAMLKTLLFSKTDGSDFVNAQTGEMINFIERGASH